MREQLSFVFSQFTSLKDRQTDRRKYTFLATRPPCIQCSGAKIILVSGEVKFIRIFAGAHPSECVEVKHLSSLAKI